MSNCKIPSFNFLFTLPGLPSFPGIPPLPIFTIAFSIPCPLD